jgi:hypothetical protein
MPDPCRAFLRTDGFGFGIGSGLLRCDFDVFDAAGRRGDRCAIRTKAIQVKLDGLTNVGLDFLDCQAGGYTSREVRNIG